MTAHLNIEQRVLARRLRAQKMSLRDMAKQRHSAKRIFERLRDEHDDDGSESHVRRYVAEVAIATARSSCPSPNHRARRSSTSARRSWRSPECG